MRMLMLLVAAPALAAPGDAARVADALTGVWDNAAQVAAAPPGVVAAPSVGGRWIDLQVASFSEVDAPLLGGRVLYVEWRGADGRVSRQRIWRFRDGAGGVAMDYYTIDRPERFAGRGREAGAFGGLTAAELTGYGPACAAVWQAAAGGWRARVDPADCLITARSGRRMRLDVTIALSDAAFAYHERGVLEGGGLAFDVPSWAPYRFARRSR